MQRFNLRRARHVIAICGVLLGLLISFQSATPAAAITKGCRGDPIVWLSDGTVMSMSASIGADAEHVRMITYTVHVPRGVRVLKVVYTGGVLKDKERVVVVADRFWGHKVEAFADLGTRVAPVTINTAIGGDRRSQSALSTSTFVFLFR